MASSPPTLLRTVLSALSLSTGAALLVYVVSGVSLLAAASLALAVGGVVAGVLWRRAAGPERAELGRFLRVGCVSGVLATAAYDVSRFILIEMTGIEFWPFDIFQVFGQALVGADQTGLAIEALGFAYHLANGVGFALAYTLLLGQRGVWAGIGWALVLEAMMVTIYPGWLGMRALDEFLQVSIVGHLVYGSVLGVTAQRLLARGAGD